MAQTKGMTIEFTADTRKLDEGLKKAQSTLNKTQSELKQVDRALKFNPGNVNLLKQKFTLLKNTVQQTEQKLQTLKQKQKTMDAKGVDKNSKEYRALQREIVKTQNQLDRAKRKLREMGSIKLTALAAQMKAIGKRMMTAGRTASMYVTAPLVAAGTVCAKKFAEVDKTMQLTNATMGNSAKEAKLLNDAMKQAAASSTFGMADAATASLNFARAGLKAKDAAAALAPAMALAAGEGGNLDTVSAGLVATINGFGDSFESTAEYADVFANACNNSALDVNSLSKAMSIAAPIFSTAGYSVKEASLFLGLMANKGIDANKAANSLKTGMARLISPAKDGAKAMADLDLYTDEGRTVFENLDGSLKPASEVLGILRDKFSGLSESEQIAAASAIFGKNQMAPWLALINSAPEEVDNLSAALDEEGTALEMQANMMSGFGGSIEQLKSGLDVLATSMGEALAPTIQVVVKHVQNLVDKFNGLSPKMQRVVAIIAVVAAAIGPVLLILGGLITAIGTIAGAISTVIGVATMAGPAIAGAFTIMTGPIGLVVAAVAGVIAIGVLLYKNWDKVKAIMTKIVNAIKSTFTKVFNAIKTKVVGVVTAIRTKIVAVMTGIKDRVATIITYLKTKVVNVVTGIKDRVVKIVSYVKDRIVTIVSYVRDRVVAIVTHVKERLVAIVTYIKEKVLKVVTYIKEKVVDKVTALKDKAKEIFDAVKTAVVDKVTALKDKVLEKFTALKDKAKEKFDAFKEKITGPVKDAKKTIGEYIDAIKDKFDELVKKVTAPFNFLGGLKKPKITIDGGKAPWGIGGEGRKPNIDVSWKAKAMQFGEILKGAQIFGMQDGKMLGGGEVGREVVAGANTVSGLIYSSVTRAMNASAGALSSAVGTQLALAGGNSQPIVIDVYLYKNGPQMGRQIVNTYDTWKGRLG